MPGKCQFHLKWMELSEFKEWLKPSKFKDMAFCSICNKEFSISGRGIGQVKAHAARKTHGSFVRQVIKQPNILDQIQFTRPTPSESAFQSSSSSVTPPPSDSPSPTTECSASSGPLFQFPAPPKSNQQPILPRETLRDQITKAEILYAFKLMDSHGSMNSCNHISDLFSLMFPDSEIAKGFRMCSDKAAYVINHGLGPYFERKIKKIMNESEFLVAQFDESLNKVSQRGQMDLHIRYIDSSNMVQTKYVTSAFLGHACAENLFTALKSCFPDDSYIEKILQLSMDGPAVNWKLADLLKDEMSSMPGSYKLLDIGSCGVHVIHGAFKTGFQKSD